MEPANLTVSGFCSLAFAPRVFHSSIEAFMMFPCEYFDTRDPWHSSRIRIHVRLAAWPLPCGRLAPFPQVEDEASRRRGFLGRIPQI